MAEAAFFLAFTSIMVIAALSVVFNRRPIYSVLSLLVVMFSLASLFVMLGAYVVAALQLLLYAGAVLVLFLFVIMLLNLSPEALARVRPFTLRTIGTVVAFFVFLNLARVFLSVPAERPLSEFPANLGGVEAIARQLFTTYLLPFELISFLILAALIGAVTLAKRGSSDK